MVRNIYRSWFEAIGIGIILLVGGTIWSQTGDHHVLGYIILFSVCYLFFLLFWNERKNREQAQQSLKQSSERHVGAIESLARDIGHKDNLYESESNICIDGTAVITRKIALEVIKGMMSSQEFLHYSPIAGIRDYGVKVSKTMCKSDISVDVVEKTSTTVRFVVKFFPPLDEGEKASYTIREEFGKGTYPMTAEEIFNYMKTGKWLSPYVDKSFLVKHPVRKLILSVLLPKNYKITTTEDFFDVKKGGFYGSRSSQEYELLRKRKCFSREVVGDKQRLKLSVDNPKIGLAYVIRWDPPSKKEYERLLHACTSRRNSKGH